MNFTQCNKCGVKKCGKQPAVTSGKCALYQRPRWTRPNTMFENLMYKDSKQADQVIRLLDSKGISYERYV